MLSQLSDYANEFGEGVAWGAIDERGHFELHGPGLDSGVPQRQAALFEGEPVRESARVVHNPFSDLGQWMLKVLLADRIPEAMLRAPRQPVAGVAELAAVAGVSPASASKFVSALAALGYID